MCLGWGFFFVERAALAEPKRVVTLFDGQNVFHAAKRCFGFPQPDYDPVALSEWVAGVVPNRQLSEIRFYTGIHRAEENPRLHDVWRRKLVGIKNRASQRGIACFVKSRHLKYSDEEVQTSNGPVVVRKGREKGIDVRIALDLVHLAISGTADVAVVFSQDSDLQEAVEDAMQIAQNHQRTLEIECAFPFSKKPVDQTHYSPYGIQKTLWRQIDKATFDKCREQAKPPAAPPRAARPSDGELQLRCIRKMLEVLRAFRAKEIWLSPFLKRDLPAEFPGLNHQEHRQVVQLLENCRAITIKDKPSRDGSTFAVIELDHDHALVVQASSMVVLTKS